MCKYATAEECAAKNRKRPSAILVLQRKYAEFRFQQTATINTVRIAVEARRRLGATASIYIYIYICIYIHTSRGSPPLASEVFC